MAHETLIIAGASRPFAGETCNGDAWQVDWRGGCCRIAIIDGLGHGPLAADAAHLALSSLQRQPDLSPEQCLRACHAALASSRGAAMAVASIDPLAHQLTYGAVGNTEASLLVDARWERLIAYRGVIGLTLPRLRTFSHTLDSDWTLVMHTDGVGTGFQLDAPPDTAHEDPQALADGILRRWARPADDAAVVVARPGQSWGLEPS